MMFDLAKFFAKTTPEPQQQSAETGALYLVVGLGNPGREYRDTRHNAGFMVIDRLSSQLNISLSRVQSKAIIGTGFDGANKILLAKPQTFMNLSGQAISSLVRFYKIPMERLLVIHDDLDIPVGTLRMRPGGGAGGQKGLKSTIEQLGTDAFPRLRVGIGRPPGQMRAADYVLEEFIGADRQTMDTVLDQACEAVRLFVREGLQTAMNHYNKNLLKE